jgi:hypothetical protein
MEDIGARSWFASHKRPCPREERSERMKFLASVNFGLCFSVVDISEGTFQKEALQLPQTLTLGWE